MASETTFDHWKVVFSWGKVRKRALLDLHFLNRFDFLDFMRFSEFLGIFYLIGPQDPCADQTRGVSRLKGRMIGTASLLHC